MEPISKTQKKRDAEALQVFGEKLLKLPDEQLDAFDLPEEIHDAVKFAKKLRHGALRRQLQYIGTLMRGAEVGPIGEIVARAEASNRKTSAAFKRTEKWREELLAGNDKLAEEIAGQCPGADLMQLNELIQKALKEKESNNQAGASKALFRYLNKIQIKS
ncbi:MAG: ribosome biogenesis factor YjgA [Thermodesulfovibrionales bacterium]